MGRLWQTARMEQDKVRRSLSHIPRLPSAASMEEQAGVPRSLQLLLGTAGQHLSWGLQKRPLWEEENALLGCFLPSTRSVGSITFLQVPETPCAAARMWENT